MWGWGGVGVNITANCGKHAQRDGTHPRTHPPTDRYNVGWRRRDRRLPLPKVPAPNKESLHISNIQGTANIKKKDRTRQDKTRQDKTRDGVGSAVSVERKGVEKNTTSATEVVSDTKGEGGDASGKLDVGSALHVTEVR